MKKTFLTILALVFAGAVFAVAADLDGIVSLSPRFSLISGQKAKANEYRVLGSGGYVGLDLSYRDPNKFLDITSNLLVAEGKAVNASVASDKNIYVKGGVTDAWKLSLYYNEIPHNWTYGAGTFFNGVGTNVLSTNILGNATNTELNAVSFDKAIDYAIKRTNFGAATELTFKTPFIFLARVDMTKTKGIKPFSFYSGSLRELPAPVDYTSDNLYLQGGYRSKPVVINIDGTFSKFKNSFDTITVQQGETLTTRLPNTAYLPPDNSFYRLAGSVMYRAPIWNTLLMARGSHSVMSSNPTINEQYSETGFINENWDGQIIYNTVNASLATNPLKKLDVRFGFNYVDRSNGSETLNSDAFNETPTSSINGVNAPVPKLGYDRKNAGIDLGYKLSASTKVNLGYDYAQTNRSRYFTRLENVTTASPYANKTTDNLLFVQVKSDLLETLSGKLRYEHLTRSSEYQDLAYQLSTSSASALRRAMFRPVEEANKNMDAFKAELDFDPAQGLNVGLRYAMKLNQYTDSPTGMQDDARHEIDADAAYMVGNIKLTVFGTWETVKANTKYFGNGSGGTWAGLTNTFFVNSNRHDLNYSLGSKIDIAIIKNKVNASFSYLYEDADGNNDLSASARGTLDAATTATIDNIVDINGLDDYRQHSAFATLTYSASKALAVSLTYMYEYFKYDDDAYAGYVYVPRGTTYALTGAYSNLNYNASVFYLGLQYKF